MALKAILSFNTSKKNVFYSFLSILSRNEGVSLPVTIGNIPHKIAFPTFDDKGDQFQRLPDSWTKKYPSVPAHSGNKYISYKMK